jgi:hypothetical protein
MNEKVESLIINTTKRKEKKRKNKRKEKKKEKNEKYNYDRIACERVHTHIYKYRNVLLPCYYSLT